MVRHNRHERQGQLGMHEVRGDQVQTPIHTKTRRAKHEGQHERRHGKPSVNRAPKPGLLRDWSASRHRDQHRRQQRAHPHHVRRDMQRDQHQIRLHFSSSTIAPHRRDPCCFSPATFELDDW
jgi:hypothetical protein